jgi:hypothetical protein
MAQTTDIKKNGPAQDSQSLDDIFNSSQEVDSIGTDILPQQDIGDIFDQSEDQEELGRFDTSGYYDFEKKYEDIQEQSKEIAEDITGTAFITDSEKKERVNQIDLMISQLEGEQNRLSKERERREMSASRVSTSYGVPIGATNQELINVYNKNIDEISSEIISLHQERQELENVLKPVTPEESSDAKSNAGIYGFSQKDFIDKHGKNRGQQIYNETVNKDFENRAKEGLKSGDTPVLSYNNLIYGEQPSLKHISNDGLNSLWKGITSNPSFYSMQYDKKRGFIEKKVKEYVSGLEEVEDKDAAANNIMANLLPKMMTTEDGMTIEGYKLFTESILDNARYMFNHVDAQWRMVAPPSKKDPTQLKPGLAEAPFAPEEEKFEQTPYPDMLISQYGPENYREWKDYTQKERSSLQIAMQMAEDILELPEVKGNFGDQISDAWKSLDGHDFISLQKMFDAVKITDITKRLEEGERITPGEEMLLEMYATMKYAEAMKTTGNLYQATRGAITMAPYVAEFALTGGLFTLGKRATIKTLAQTTRKIAGKQASRTALKIADFASNNMARAVGVGFQSLAMPQHYVEKMATNMRPDVVLNSEMGELQAEIMENTGDPAMKSFMKGFASTYAEMGFERAGSVLLRTPGFIGKKGAQAANFLSKKAGGKNIFTSKLTDDFMRMKGIKSVQSMNDYVKKHHLGWHGIREEYLEELATAYADSVITEGRLPSWRDPEFRQEQLVTLMTVGMFGMPMQGLNVASSYIVGGNVRYNVKDPQTGEEKILSLPRNMHEELAEVVKRPGVHIDGDAIDEILRKYEGQLDSDQYKLAIQILQENYNQKAADFISQKVPGAKVTEEQPVPDYDPHIISKQEEVTPEALTKEDLEDVEKFNVEISKKYPDLARVGLLPKDETSGQIVEPTENTMRLQLNNLSTYYNKNVETDKAGNPINVTPELENIQEQIDVLENQMIEFAKEKDLSFNDLQPRDKNLRLSSQLQEGKTITGTPVDINDDVFRLELPDGRSVNVFYHDYPTDVTKEQILDSVKSGETVQLKHQDWKEWNPDLKVKDTLGVPYRGRIQAYIGNNPIGHVQYNNFEVEDIEATRKDAAKKQVSDNLSKSITSILDSIITEPIEEETEEEKKEDSQITKKLKDAITYWQNLSLPAREKVGIHSKEYDLIQKAIDDGILVMDPNTKNVIPKKPSSLKAGRTIIDDINRHKERNTNEWNATRASVEQYFNQKGLAVNNTYGFAQAKKLFPIKNDKLNKQLHRIVDPFLNKTNASIRVTNQIPRGSAEYDWFNNTITLPIDNITAVVINSHMIDPGISVSDVIHYLLLHEGVHAFSASKLKLIYQNDAVFNNNSPLVDVLKSVMPISEKDREIAKELTKLLNYLKLESREEEFYGITNEYELVAEAMSNQQFVKFLLETEVPPEVSPRRNAFAAIIEFMYKLLGLKKVDNSAFQKVVNLTVELGESYNANDLDRFVDVSSRYGEATGNIYLSLLSEDVEKPEDKITEENKNEVFNNIIDSINSHNWSQIAAEEAIDVIHETIDNAQLSPRDKGILKALVNDNQETIQDNINKRKLQAAGLTQFVEDLKIEDLVTPEIQSFVPSGAQKVDALLQGYAPIWRNIAAKLNTTRDLVEKKMYQIAKVPNVNSNLQNEGLFNSYLKTLEGDNQVTNEIVDVLRNSSFSSAVSLFNFYSNLQLTKQYGMIFNKGKLSIRLLNPSQRYEEFVRSFNNRMDNYVDSLTGKRGYEAVKTKIQRHNQERDERFQSKNQNWTWYNAQTPEDQEILRRAQHKSDVSLLSEFTGIPTNIWNQYFSSQTNETQAATSPSGPLVEFGDYDNLLKKDTYRGKYHRIQSNLALNMSLLIWNKQESRTATTAEFEDKFISFITEGNEDRAVLSNLYKLSTAIVEKDDIGLRGVDVKNDNFNSFVQSSNVSDIADNILESNVDNHIVDYYKNEGRVIDVIHLGGVRRIDGKSKTEGAQALDMSNQDMWISQLNYFIQPGETYMHWIGQFGDKPVMMVIEVPKVENPTDEQISELKKEFEGFDKAASEFQKRYVNPNEATLSDHFKKFDPRKDDIAAEKKKLARAFVYNFARNIKATNTLFFGSMDSYSDKGPENTLTDMIKRAGSSNSPGYRLNHYVEGGVGETYQFALIDDEIEGWEMFDGVEVVTDDYATRMQVSMGSVFSKVDSPEMDTLSSVKALTSFIDPNTGLRGLTKTNRLNIDIFAESFPDSKYSQLRDFMRSNGIDVLSFTSGTKKSEVSQNRKSVSIKLWNKDGSLIKKPVIPENSIISRKTKDVYIQQDLRHSTAPKATKMPSQLLANMMILPSGPVISRMINDLQITMMDIMVSQFKGEKLDDVKIDWLNENVNPETQADIYRLLELGMTPYEPALTNYMRKMIASQVTRKALEIPINRTTTQEVPDADGLLEGRREWKGTIIKSDGEEVSVRKILLPDVAANIDGVRYENKSFDGHPDDAIAYVEKNKSEHEDLFDHTGTLMRWEIVGRNGIIPGEPVITTRIPADDLHSHTVGRLKYKITSGNFTMLDKESQLASGSDFDGDQRFNQVFFKKKGKAIFGESKEGIANQMMMRIVEDYQNPNMDSHIKSAINTNQYDDLVEKYREGFKTIETQDWRSYNQSRNENMVGVKMKGILTDAVTIYSLINSRNIDFKRHFIFKSGNKNILLNGIKPDIQGKMKYHLTNLLNMAFDNAADPKIEIMGLNEVTSNMFILSFIGSKSIDTTNEDEIMTHLSDIVRYFNSPAIRRFTELMRADAGGLAIEDFKKIKSVLTEEFGEAKMKEVTNFYLASQEFPKLRRFYNLTQKASGTTPEYLNDRSLYDNVESNNKEEFSFIDVINLFEHTKTFIKPVTEFENAKLALDISEKYIYSDTFMMSKTGNQIMTAILDKIPKRKRFTLTQLKYIDTAMNNIAAVKALGVKKTAESIEKELLANIDKYREQFPDNKFLQKVHKVKRGKKRYIEINPDNRQGKIDDSTLIEARRDFDSLWQDEKGKHIAEMFASLNLSKWGAVTSTFRGSYYTLLGDEFRVDLSKKVSNELKLWQEDELSSVEKLKIFDLVTAKAFDEQVKGAAMRGAEMEYYDYEALVFLETPISMEGLESMTSVSNANEYIQYAEERGFDPKIFADNIRKLFNIPETERSVTRTIIPAVEKAIGKYNERALRLFPTGQNTDTSMRNLMQGDVVGEALATEDPELREFVYNWLKKTYPGVEYFNSPEKFERFINKWGGRGFNIDPHAIGHAFANAIYIDETKEVQHALMHEMSHIYYDALPEDNRVKVRMRKLYREMNPSWMTDDQIDELIVLDVGRAGTELAKIEMSMSRFERFKRYLRNLWQDIKKFFGIDTGKSQHDNLVDELAMAMFNNQYDIHPTTGHGKMVLRNLINYDYSQEENPNFREEGHIHEFNGMPIPSVTSAIGDIQSEQFDVEVRSRAAAIKQHYLYRGLTKERWTEEEQRLETNAMYSLWKDEVQDAGNAIHLVAEEIFSPGGVEISEQDILDNFESREVYESLKEEFIRMKNLLLRMYPEARFYPEKHLISKKFLMGGYADLVVDIGDNKLLVYDFKSADQQYADEDLEPLPEYKKQYGLMKPPFQNLPDSKLNKHTLQLNMYSNMLEEAESDRKPGEKNTVIQLRIVPIIRTLSKGKVTKAKIGNFVKIPRNEKSKSMSEKIMKLNHLQRQDLMKTYPKFRDTMIAQDIHPAVVDDMLKALHYFRTNVGNIKKVNKDEISIMRNEGFKALLSKLLSTTDVGGLGFKLSDLEGSDALTAEELFMIATNERIITRKQYFGYKDKDTGVLHPPLRDEFWVEQEMYSRFNPVRNPDKVDRKWHRYESFVLEDIGRKDVKIGDRIMMIYDIPRKSGRQVREHYMYTVEKINHRTKKVHLKSQETEDVIQIYMHGDNDGMLRMHDSLPENVQDPGPNSYVPSYNYEIKTDVEYHWKPSEKSNLDKTDPTGSQKISREFQQRSIWSFFNKNKYWGNLQEFLKNSDDVHETYSKFSTYDEKMFEPIIMFFREEAANHMFAQAISRENNQYEKIPKHILPQTLNMFYVITNHDNAIWNDFHRGQGFRNWLPPRTVANKYVPLSIFTSQTESEYKKYIQFSFELNQVMKKFHDNINYEVATKEYRNERYWKRPGEVRKNRHPLEHEFLTELYKYYERYDPEFKERKKAETNPSIRISRVYASRTEFVDKYGSRFGPVLHEKLAPKPYDTIRLKALKGFDHNGKPMYELDDNGKPVVKSLGQIKEEFIHSKYSGLTQKEKERYLGKKWNRFVMKIPGSSKIFGATSMGVLTYQIDKAKEVYRKGSDEHNLTNVIKRKKRSIPIIGRGSVIMQTRHWVAAENQALDSMIFSHYMKRLMAPLDYMLNKYQNSGDGQVKHVMKYLEDWGNYQLYNLRPEDQWNAFGSDQMSDIINFANRMNSMNKIMFSPMTQVNNMMIGQAMDIIREPVAYSKGLKRLLFSGNTMKSMRKARLITKRYGLANFVDDATFDIIEKEMIALGVDWNKVENAGYLPMETVEKLNQMPVFVGLMTDEEWDAYDEKGRVKKGKESDRLTDYRLMLISSRVQDIHGDYGTFNAAPAWLTNLGKAVMPFRKWLPAMLWAHLAPYHIDRNLMVRSGILASIRLAGKVITYNVKTTEKKQAERVKEIQEKADKGELTDAFFTGVGEYFETLVESANGDKIKWKTDLSQNDRQNIISAALEIMFLSVNALVSMLLLGGDDKEAYMREWKRSFGEIFKRYQGDVFYIFNIDSWEFLKENVIPSMSLILNMGKLITDISRYLLSFVAPEMQPKAYHLKDTKYARQGSAKFPISATHVLPGGAAMRWALKRKEIFLLKRQYNTLYNLGLTPADLPEVDKKELSDYQIREMSYKYKKFMRRYILAQTYLQLQLIDTDPSVYYDALLGEKMIKRNQTALEDAMKMYAIDAQIEDGTLGMTMDEINDLAKKMEDIQKTKLAGRKREIFNNFEEALEILE